MAVSPELEQREVRTLSDEVSMMLAIEQKDFIDQLF